MSTTTFRNSPGCSGSHECQYDSLHELHSDDKLHGTWRPEPPVCGCLFGGGLCFDRCRPIPNGQLVGQVQPPFLYCLQCRSGSGDIDIGHDGRVSFSHRPRAQSAGSGNVFFCSQLLEIQHHHISTYEPSWLTLLAYKTEKKIEVALKLSLLLLPWDLQWDNTYSFQLFRCDSHGLSKRRNQVAAGLSQAS